MNLREKKLIAEFLSWLYLWSRKKDFVDDWQESIPEKLWNRIPQEYVEALECRAWLLEEESNIENWVFNFCEELFFMEYESIGENWLSEDEHEIAKYTWQRILKSFSKKDLLDVCCKMGYISDELVEDLRSDRT